MDGSQREDEHEHKAAFSWAPDPFTALSPAEARLFVFPSPPLHFKHTPVRAEKDSNHSTHSPTPPIPPCLRPTNFSVPYFSFYTTLATLRLCFDCVL